MAKVVITRHEVSTYEFVIDLEADLSPYVDQPGMDGRAYLDISDLPEDITDAIDAAVDAEESKPDHLVEYLRLEIETVSIHPIAEV